MHFGEQEPGALKVWSICARISARTRHYMSCKESLVIFRGLHSIQISTFTIAIFKEPLCRRKADNPLSPPSFSGGENLA